MEDCIFCKIIKNEIPANKIYENDNILAFLDVRPVNMGHSLVIPKKHFVNIHDTPEEIIAEMAKIVKIIAKVIKSEMKASGITIQMNNDVAAGQVIFHSHIHVIPRFTNDGFGLWYGKRQYKEGEAIEIAQKITQAL